MSNEDFHLTPKEDEDMEANDEPPNDFEKVEGLLTFMKKLFEDLNQLRDLLRVRNQNAFVDKSREVLATCDLMLSACHIYLGPILLNIFAAINSYIKHT